MEKTEALQYAIDLIQSAEAAYLTTIDNNGFPQTRALLNLRNAQQYPSLTKSFKKHDNNFLAYFTTNTSSQKVAQILHNKNVSVYYSIPVEWRGLMLGGAIEIILDKKLKNEIWQNNWDMYYPQGADDPDYTLLVLKPTIAKLYHQLDSYTFTIG